MRGSWRSILLPFVHHCQWFGVGALPRCSYLSVKASTQVYPGLDFVCDQVYEVLVCSSSCLFKYPTLT
jgi:hypothetical protein